MNETASKNRRRIFGFTMIELLIVIGLIGVLAGIVLVTIGTVRDKARLANLNALAGQIDRTLGVECAGKWDFDEGTGSAAADTCGNNLTTAALVVGTTWVSSINNDTALSFNGSSDYVAVQRSYDQVGVLPEVTACALFKTDFVSGTANANWALIDFDRTEYFNLYVQGNGTIGFSTAPDSGSVDDMDGDGVFNDDEWHYVCGVYDGTDKVIYVDGIEDDREPNPHSGRPLGTGTTRFGIIGDGSEASTFPNGSRNNIFYEGEIDSVRVYHEAIR